MRVGILGTGTVGRTLSARLSGLGHDVSIGTRDVDATLSRTEPDDRGNPPFARWLDDHPAVRLQAYADIGGDAELVLNATSGTVSLDALRAVGAENLTGKPLLDVSNPLDFSHGFPPTLSVANTDSLGEQIQREFPEARVVKTLNTMNALVMADPSRVPGDHVVFVAGDDAGAKATTTALLQEMGWPARAVVDLGGIRAARGCEMYLPLWVTLYGALGTGDFNIALPRATPKAG